MSISAKLRKPFTFALVTLLLLVVPVDFSPARGFEENRACAVPDNGACCIAMNDICWTPGGTLYNHYYSPTGSCG